MTCSGSLSGTFQLWPSGGCGKAAPGRQDRSGPAPANAYLGTAPGFQPGLEAVLGGCGDDAQSGWADAWVTVAV
ncbi:MAG: hypothetical protein AMXMBFR58_28330 [Phycisphaerae bacterium]